MASDLNKSGERKQVTVLFSDLTGYTSLNEVLDPEDVNDIMNRIFGEISQVVKKYEGCVDKFLGDAAMILFGIPKAHEDDPARAIRVALEIHKRVEALSRRLHIPEINLLQMHSGINTGLVVTGASQHEIGTYAVTGDTVNVASRLEGLAGPGEILVGEATYIQTEGLYNFKALSPAVLKGKTNPMQIYKVASPKSGPGVYRRVCGMRADLVGRENELLQMERALNQIDRGSGTVLAVCGDAGTGKSRLVEEFKTDRPRTGVQWFEGHSYPFAKNRPYSLFIDLLNRTFRIKEDDPPAKMRDRVEAGIKEVVGDRKDVAPYVSGLFSIHHVEADSLSPEIWKERLQSAIREILTALAGKAATIICLEDLHWADPSSLELLEFIISDYRYPLMLICVYRPGIRLSGDRELDKLGAAYRKIGLNDLSPSQTREMARSMLNTDTIPDPLRRFIDQKVEGNPFYLEEVINSLTESGVLVYENHRWVITKPINDMDIPPTVQGVIAGRVDRLDTETKIVLQEASVIGRSFNYAVLKKITRIGSNIDVHLAVMEQLDLITTKSRHPDLEYVFKHALIQEVVYNGLLKKERKSIHERIGKTMEDMFAERLAEHVEKLAFHFQRGHSSHKAVDYLIKSGEKSLRRYALEESHRYFGDAYDMLDNNSVETVDDLKRLVALLNKWSFVYYYRGRYRELLQILNRHRELAESLNDTELLGMFYAWMGCALWHRERFRDAHRFLSASLVMGEKSGNDQIIGYSSCWLAWACTELGLLDQALDHADRGRQIFESGAVDPYIFINSLAGKGYALWHRGERRKTMEVGKILLDFADHQSDSRSKVMGYCCLGWGHLISGDVKAAAECFQKAMDISTDPWYAVFPKLALCYGFITNNQLENAGQLIDDILAFSRERGAEFAGTPAAFFRGVALIAGGQLNTGFNILQGLLRDWWERGSRLRYVLCGQILATIYADLTRNPKGLGPITVVKNLRAIFNALPFTGARALDNFEVLTEMTRDIGANGALGRAYLHWGHLLKERGQVDRAGQCYIEAAKFFEQCEADGYLKQANEAMGSVLS